MLKKSILTVVDREELVFEKRLREESVFALVEQMTMTERRLLMSWARSDLEESGETKIVCAWSSVGTSE